MRILVTRPMPDAETTAAELALRGHVAVLAPMLETRFVDWAEIRWPTQMPGALIATSPNGVRGLGSCPDIDHLTPLPLFVAGEASARLARSFGFVDVRAAHGDAKDVVAQVTRELPKSAAILYAAGHDRSGDIGGDLAACGYHVDMIEVYSAIAATTLSDSAAVALRSGCIDRILVFSARTADALVSILNASDLLASCQTIPIHVISHQAAEPLRLAGFRSIVVALRPDAAQLLATLDSKP